MVLYTVFAWTAIIVAGATYYWVYIRRQPLPTHLLGLAPKTISSVVDTPSSTTRKRKQKETLKRRTTPSQTNNPDPIQDESVLKDKPGPASPQSAKNGPQTFKKSIIVPAHSAASDADESDALDTPSPLPKQVPAPMMPAGPKKTAAEAHFEKTTPKTAVDDMLSPEDRPTVARVLRISSPTQDTTTTPTRQSNSRPSNTGTPLEKDGLTKKQRQNQKKKERHREARAREEAERQQQLRAHQKQLEEIRLNSQIKAAEKRSSDSSAPTNTNAWSSGGGGGAVGPRGTGAVVVTAAAGQGGLGDSVYTVQNLSEENLTTVGHRSDGAASEEGWQEVTSRSAKRASQKEKVSEKSWSGTERSEVGSSVGESEEVKGHGSSTATTAATARKPYASSNSFANLDS